jgi:hypothetical protein
VGKFESSNYSNPANKPDYLRYMDDNHDYRVKYSGKFIYDAGMSLSVVRNMLLDLQPNSWRCPQTNSRRRFGLGCIQWTAERTFHLVNTYLEITGGNSVINLEQATRAEGLMIVRELKNAPKPTIADYRSIHRNWQTENSGNLNSEDAAYDAGHRLCMRYLIPDQTATKAVERGNHAREIYSAMMR